MKYTYKKAIHSLGTVPGAQLGKEKDTLLDRASPRNPEPSAQTG